MTSAHTMKLGLTTRKTSIGAQKIDGSPLKTYNMVLASFSLQDSQWRFRFIEKTFLLANTSIKVVLGMLFLALNNADFRFGAKNLTLRTYTIAEALPTTNWLELINKRKFAKTALNENSETFVMHVSALDVAELSIYLS